MNTPSRRSRPALPSAAFSAAILTLLGTPALSQAKDSTPAPPPLGKAATEAMVARFDASEHWVQKAVILLSLNHYWHPSGSGMILSAVRDRDKRLRAYGIEALLRAETGLLPVVASAELIEELILKQLKQSNKHYQSRVLAVLERIAPDAKIQKKSKWASWWRNAKESYTPQPWKAKVIENTENADNTVAFAERAFDLYNSGLDLGICIDSTGSMQPSIDAVGAALGEMVDILKGISPKLRIGIAHYKEKGDFGDRDRVGAKVILPLSKNIANARKRLQKLKAAGGGDLPEQITGGLAVTLGRRMKWKHDTNKAVIVIGDAPPHDLKAATELAKKGREDPGSVSKAPLTGAKKPRPFVTSAIGVRLAFPPQVQVPPPMIEAQNQMRKDLTAIAEAGGGVYAEMVFRLEVNKRGQIAPTETKQASSAAQKMVEHILVLSFGRRFVREMRAFVAVYYAYKNARFFK